MIPIPSWGQIKLIAAVGLLFVTFTLGVKVTRDHYLAKENKEKIAQLENAVRVRDELSVNLRKQMEEQERVSLNNAERIRQYEAFLRDRPNSCRLTSDDVRWLQQLRSPPSTPTR